jgi:GrpB-like predicted nucleotidyltransferase (UPF0157 family)
MDTQDIAPNAKPNSAGSVLPPVVIVPYDPTWPAKFEVERGILTEALAPWLSGPVEHIGSTAVPGLPAKPVIDIGAPVSSLEESVGAIDALRPLSYCYFPYKADIMHWFCKPSDQHRTHHLHIVPVGSELWQDRLLFRDYLRMNREVAEEYAALKMRLAVAHRSDREAYTELKSDFILKTIEDARHALFGRS